MTTTEKRTVFAELKRYFEAQHVTEKFADECAFGCNAAIWFEFKSSNDTIFAGVRFLHDGTTEVVLSTIYDAQQTANIGTIENALAVVQHIDSYCLKVAA